MTSDEFLRTQGGDQPRVCVLEVNETLPDLGALDPHFEQIFDDTSVRRVIISIGYSK